MVQTEKDYADLNLKYQAAKQKADEYDDLKIKNEALSESLIELESLFGEEHSQFEEFKKACKCNAGSIATTSTDVSVQHDTVIAEIDSLQHQLTSLQAELDGKLVEITRKDQELSNSQSKVADLTEKLNNRASTSDSDDDDSDTKKLMELNDENCKLKNDNLLLSKEVKKLKKKSGAGQSPTVSNGVSAATASIELTCAKKELESLRSKHDQMIHQWDIEEGSFKETIGQLRLRLGEAVKLVKMEFCSLRSFVSIGLQTCKNDHSLLVESQLSKVKIEQFVKRFSAMSPSTVTLNQQLIALVAKTDELQIDNDRLRNQISEDKNRAARTDAQIATLLAATRSLAENSENVDTETEPVIVVAASSSTGERDDLIEELKLATTEVLHLDKSRRKCEKKLKLSKKEVRAIDAKLGDYRKLKKALEDDIDDLQAEVALKDSTISKLQSELTNLQNSVIDTVKRSKSDDTIKEDGELPTEDDAITLLAASITCPTNTTAEEPKSLLRKGTESVEANCLTSVQKVEKMKACMHNYQLENVQLKAKIVQIEEQAAERLEVATERYTDFEEQVAQLGALVADYESEKRKCDQILSHSERQVRQIEMLQSQLKDSMDNLAVLNGKINCHMTEKEALKNELGSLKSEKDKNVSELEAKLNALNGELTALGNVNTDLSRSNADLTLKLKPANESAQIHVHDLALKNDSIKLLETTANGYVVEISELKKALETATTEIKDLNESAQIHVHDLALKNDSIKLLETTANGYVVEISELKKALETATTEIKDLNEKLEQSSIGYRDVELKLIDSETSVQTLNKSRDTYQKQLDGKDREVDFKITRQSVVIARQTAVIEKYQKDEQGSYEEVVSKLKNVQEICKQSNEKHSKKLKEKEKEIKRLYDEISTLSSDCSAAKVEREELQSKLKSADEKCIQLEAKHAKILKEKLKEIKQLSDEMSARSSKLKSVMAEKEALVSQLKTADEKYRKVDENNSKTLKDKEKENKQLNKDVVKLSEDLNSVKVKHEELQSKLNTADEKCRNHAETYSKTLEEKETEIKRLNDDVEELSSSLKSVKVELEDSLLKLKAADDKYVLLDVEYAQFVKKNEKEELESKLRTADEKCRNLAETHSKTLKEKEKEIKQLNKDVTKLSDELKSVKVELELVVSKLKISKEKSRTIAETHSKTLKDKGKEIKRLNGDIAKLSSDLKSLKVELEESALKLKTADGKYEILSGRMSTRSSSCSNINVTDVDAEITNVEIQVLCAKLADCEKMISELQSENASVSEKFVKCKQEMSNMYQSHQDNLILLKQQLDSKTEKQYGPLEQCVRDRRLLIIESNTSPVKSARIVQALGNLDVTSPPDVIDDVSVTSAATQTDDVTATISPGGSVSHEMYRKVVAAFSATNEHMMTVKTENAELKQQSVKVGSRDNISDIDTASEGSSCSSLARPTSALRNEDVEHNTDLLKLRNILKIKVQCNQRLLAHNDRLKAELDTWKSVEEELGLARQEIVDLQKVVDELERFKMATDGLKEEHASLEAAFNKLLESHEQQYKELQKVQYKLNQTGPELMKMGNRNLVDTVKSLNDSNNRLAADNAMQAARAELFKSRSQQILAPFSCSAQHVTPAGPGGSNSTISPPLASLSPNSCPGNSSPSVSPALYGSMFGGEGGSNPPPAKRSRSDSGM